MTAVNIVLRAQAAYIFTDSLGIYGDRLCYNFGKVHPLLHMRGAITVRGNSEYGIMLARQASLCESFDEAAENFGKALEHIVTATKGMPIEQPNLRSEAYLVGFAARDTAPQAIVAYTQEADGIPPFVPFLLRGVVAPKIDDDGTMLAAILDRDQFNPENDDHALGLLEGQRVISGERIGGSACVVRITRKSINYRELRRWDGLRAD